MAARNDRPERSPAGEPQAGRSSTPALRISDLIVEFDTPAGTLRAVDGVAYQVQPGETLAVVGETGSGKSVTVLAALGLLSASNTSRISGRVEVAGVDLLSLSPRDRRRRLGRDVAMIFQDPMSALDPVQRIGDQIAEALRAHDRAMSGRAARSRAIELLRMVGVPGAEARYGQYPHQFSGGMSQRVVIAIAIANQPRVLIADEPTTALDVSVQAQILDLIRVAAAESGAATVLITHDLGVVAEMADRVAVMYAGRIVETAGVRELFDHPRHPYAAALLASRPRLDRARGRLRQIPGSPPDLLAPIEGCPFAPRCPIGYDLPECHEQRPELVAAVIRSDPNVSDPNLSEVTRAGMASATTGSTLAASACHHPDKVGSIVEAPAEEQLGPAAAKPDRSVAVEVREVRKAFGLRRGLLGRSAGVVQAVDGVNLVLAAGTTLGLIGESGCGKTTLARTLLRLIEPDAGSISIEGRDLLGAGRSELRQLRRRVQMVFQDPFGSLNPQLSVGDNVAEPLRLAGVPQHQRRVAVLELFEKVGLSPEHVSRLPAEFSGGQRQRVAIARALAPDPAVVVLDEPVSALDVSVQAQVLNLLTDLQRETGVGYLFVSHDLSVVRQVADRLAVMYLGAIVETGEAEQIYRGPRHPYTRALLESAPVPEPGAPRVRVPLAGDPPDPVARMSGCRFRSRCPLSRGRDLCQVETPELRLVDGRLTACHFAEELAA